MKKRLLSMLLALVLAVSLLPISASAATTKLDGVVYTTVSTAKELSDALAKGGNILLTNDITLDLTFANAFSVKQGTLLNGNGYSIVCSAARVEPLFCYEPGTEIGQSATYIKNLNFGTASVPMKLAGQVALFLENGNDTTYVIYENVNFFVKGSNLTGTMGALYKSLKGVTYIYGCTLNADLTYTGSGLFGAWFGEINGAELVMNDCTTTGTIKGNGLCTAGILGQSGSGNSRFTNCINLADITGAELTAGLAGNVGTAANSMYFSNCKNFGNITSRGTKYSGAAGGILARSSNVNDQGDKRLRVFYDCINYGTITAGARAGGILGTSHDWDTAGPGTNYAYYTFGGCINYGTVSAGEYAGGIMGIASPVTYRAEITDCINVGKISSTKGYAGNFAGMLCSGVITGGYAAGVVSSKMGTDPIVPCVNGGYTLQEGVYEGAKWSVTAPSASGVTYIGASDKVGKGVTKATGEALTAALQAMSSIAGVTFVEADSDDANACVVAAEPIVRGVQQSVNIANGALSFRFAAGLNARKGLASFGFRIKIHENGQTTERTVIASALYTSLNATSDGKKTVVSAESLGSNYLYTATVDGITVGSGAIVEVTPYTVNKNGTVYNGNTRVIYCDNNDCRIKPLMLNGTALESYAIVYAKSDTMSEQLLATRMSSEIAKLTGIALPVLSDAQGTSKKAKIVIGKSSLVSGAVTGRTLRTQGDASVIVISGTNTGELSESIDYFVSNIEQRMIAGNNSWSFTSVDVPVDDEITLMAYNMGAKDKANIKKAEWDLIVDYLPDIWTSQEPWAGFLDDFLNDYAVKPATKFQEDATDDDVMKSDVNNKAFTGSGYYGVYWGLPRWVPGDANTNGKASYSVILYAKDRFTPDLTRSGTFWLSEKVNTSGTTYTGSNFPRCATYLTLTDNNTGKTFTVVNVHLDFVASVQIAQVNILLRELKARLGADMPIFVTGDMNSEAQSTPIALYKDNDYMDMTAMDEVAERSYRVRRNIDWFFTNHPEQVEISYYNNCFENTYLNNQWNSELIMGMPSDHPAIYTEFKFR